MDFLSSWLQKAADDLKARPAGVSSSGIAPNDFTNTIQGPALKVAQVGIPSIGYTYFKGACTNTSFGDNLVFNSPSRPCYNIQIVNNDTTNWIQWSYDGISVAGELEVGEFTTDALVPAFSQLYLLCVTQGAGGTTCAFKLKVW